MVSFDDFKNEWMGKRVPDLSLIGHGETANTCYQCVSLIKQYIRELCSIEPGAWGNAIDYWSITNPALLQKFTKDNSGSVQKGDIVVLRTLGHDDYTEPGHIGIATGNGDPNSIEILEQNGLGSKTGLGQDAIRTRYIPRNRLAGVLRSIPVAPSFSLDVQPLFADHHAVRYQVRLGANKFNLDLSTLSAVATQTVGTASADMNKPTYIWCTDWLTRSDNDATYFLEDGNLHQGWDKRDLIETPLPTYVPPAAPYTAPPVEKYHVIVTLMYFPSGNEAIHKSNYQGNILPGEYYVITKNGNAYNLSDDNMKDRGQWVNIDDNKIPEPVIPTLPVDPPPAHDEPVDFPPVIEQPKIVSHSLKASGEVVMYQATNSQPIEIRDYQTGQSTITMQPYNYSSNTGKNEPVPLVSTFTVNGTEYGRTQKVSKAGWFYGVPMDDLELYELPEATVAVHTQPPVPRVSSFDTNKDGKVDLRDFTDGISDFIDYGSKWFRGTVAPIVPKITEAKQKLSKSVDGFSKRSK